jgi:hypothetical protein
LLGSTANWRDEVETLHDSAMTMAGWLDDTLPEGQTPLDQTLTALSAFPPIAPVAIVTVPVCDSFVQMVKNLSDSTGDKKGQRAMRQHAAL